MSEHLYAADSSLSTPLEGAQNSYAVTEQQPPIIVINNGNYGHRRRHSTLISAAAAIAIAVMGIGRWAPKIHEIDSVTSGKSDVLAIADDFSLEIGTFKEINYGYAEHDADGPIKNPWSQIISVSTTKEIEYRPNGALVWVAEDDPDIGFHVIVREMKDGIQKPLEFTYDTPDDGVDTKDATIIVKVPQPDICGIKIDNGLIPASDCPSIDDPLSPGIMSVRTSTGAPGFKDGEISATARKAFDIAVQNAYCPLIVMGATNINQLMLGDVSKINQRTIHDGFEDAVMAAFRINYAKQSGLLLTQENGDFYVIDDNERTILKTIAKEAGKPIPDMSEEELRGYLNKYELDKTLDPNGPRINPGPTYISQLLDAQEKDGDIRLPDSDPPINRDNGDSSRFNYTCIRQAGTDAGDKMIENYWKIQHAGVMGMSPANATPQADGSYVSAAEAQQLFDAYKESVGV